MNIDESSMNKVNDVNKRSMTTSDLRLSANDRWRMNEAVQDQLNLDSQNGLVMYVAFDEDTGEQVVLVEVVDSDEADFFTGEGNVFTAHRLADAVSDEQFTLSPVEDMENTYALQTWEGQSEILTDMIPSTEESSDEGDTIDSQLSDFADNSDGDEEVTFA